MSDYDAISIGSGLGGLTASALAALEGKRVLVLERHDKLGGAATTFKRKGHTFEASLHKIDGLDPNDAKYNLLERLGIRDEVEFVPIDEFYQVRHPSLGEDFLMPANYDQALAETIERFPKHEANIKIFFETIAKIREKIAFMSKKQGQVLYWILTAVTVPFRFFIVGKHEKTTVGDFLDRLFGNDEAVKYALCANLCYYADDPHKLSLLYFAAAQGSFWEGGCYYIKGGSMKLSEALSRKVEKAGGAALTNREVRHVIVENGKAVGVVHVDKRTGQDPQEARAGVIFGNAAPSVLSSMIPQENRGVFAATYEDKPLSLSLWQLHLVLNKPARELGVDAYSTFVYSDSQKAFAEMRDQSNLLKEMPKDRIPTYVLVDYSRIDSGLSSSEGHVLSVSGVDKTDNWEDLDEDAYKAKKDAWMKAVLGDLDRRYPGFESEVVHCEMATAATMSKFLNAPEGAIYGISQEPRFAGRFRPPARTKLPGLYLASAHALPGGGFTGAMLAGQGAYRTAKRDKLI